MKLFGVGLNKTGTKTLGECFKTFGFNNKSFDLELLQSFSRGDFQEIYRTCDHFDSFEDWPWPLLYREFDLHYPGSKFILTQRKDPETWFASLCKHADMTGPTEARKIAYGFEMPHNHKSHHIDIYRKHNADVIHYFKDTPEKLLVVSWERGDGWAELCKFLGYDKMPDTPFPHKNKSQVA
ncbi:MAG: sulfotransferase family protein [Bacteroidetes bacterium]|nr:sulfotransferase family protein [Bacteroidota bacterium]